MNSGLLWHNVRHIIIAISHSFWLTLQIKACTLLITRVVVNIMTVQLDTILYIASFLCTDILPIKFYWINMLYNCSCSMYVFYQRYMHSVQLASRGMNIAWQQSQYSKCQHVSNTCKMEFCLCNKNQFNALKFEVIVHNCF